LIFLTRNTSAQFRRDQKHYSPHNLFPVQRSDLLDKTVDFFRRQFAGVFGHPALAIGYGMAQVFY
jgi:hypothetical protein